MIIELGNLTSKNFVRSYFCKINWFKNNINDENKYPSRCESLLNINEAYFERAGLWLNPNCTLFSPTFRDRYNLLGNVRHNLTYSF